MKRIYARNPWGILTVQTPERIFWNDTLSQWFEDTADGPRPCRDLNELYPDGPYDPGCTGSAWWWYAKMVPWLADALRKRYGNEAVRPTIFDGLRHPGLKWFGKKPEDQIIRRNGISWGAIREYEAAKQRQILEEIAFMEHTTPENIVPVDPRSIVRVLWDALRGA